MKQMYKHIFMNKLLYLTGKFRYVSVTFRSFSLMFFAKCKCPPLRHEKAINRTKQVFLSAES